MMETEMITRMLAGLVALSLTTSLSLADAGDIFHPQAGGSHIDISDAFHQTDDDNDDPWDPIFNPQPETKPTIYKKIPGLFGDNPPAPGQMVDYEDVAKLNSDFALSCS